MNSVMTLLSLVLFSFISQAEQKPDFRIRPPVKPPFKVTNLLDCSSFRLNPTVKDIFGKLEIEEHRSTINAVIVYKAKIEFFDFDPMTGKSTITKNESFPSESNHVLSKRESDFLLEKILSLDRLERAKSLEINLGQYDVILRSKSMIPLCARPRDGHISESCKPKLTITATASKNNARVASYVCNTVPGRK